MMRHLSATLVLACTSSGLWTSQAAAQEPPVVSEQRIDWRTDLETALKEPSRSGVPTVVAFFAAWCPACRRFREDTLPSRTVQDLAAKFIWVLVDIDREVSIARARRVETTPRFDVIDRAGVTRAQVHGVLPPEAFRRALQDALVSIESGAPHELATSRGEDLTPLTWSPSGYRAISICFSNVGYGPLNLPSQSPLQSLRSTFRPRTPSTLAQGHAELREIETWVNIWSRGSDHILDYEMLRSSVSLAYGLADTLELEVEIAERRRFGGAMDGLVQSFHDLFHIDQGGRDEVPLGAFSFDLGAPPTSSEAGAGLFSQELLVVLQHNITCGTYDVPALSYALEARIDRSPTHDLSGSPVAMAASVSAAKRLGEIYGYVELGLAWFGSGRFQEVPLQPLQGSILFALEWRFRPELSFVAQFLISEGAAIGFRPFSRPSFEVTMGFKAEFHRGVVLEAGFIENVLIPDNSPDAGFHAGLTFRL